MAVETPLTRWQRAKLVVKVIEVRLRFIVILVVTGLVIGYWDVLQNHWAKWTRPEGAAVASLAPDGEFYCPMHPQVVRDGLDPNGAIPKCPICGMPLAQRKKGEAAPLPPGVTARVQLSPERIQLAGIATEEVVRRPLEHEVTTVGDVRYDETRLSRIVSRTSGYVEKLFVNQTFLEVKKGEALAEVYSPELFSSSGELLAAAGSNALPELTAKARQRLGLLGVADEEIDAILKSGRATPRVVIRAPRQGHVIEKSIVEGARIETGMTLFEVADLSTVWIEAAVYEKDIRFLRAGEAVEATLEAIPGRIFDGKIALVHPHLEPTTRTNTVRLILENPEHELRPGMFATVRIKTPIEGGPDGAGVLAVPERAVIDTGAKKIVYIEREPGLFEGVLVELGPRVGAFYPVRKGLELGQRVASAGAFLVDAETRLNPAAGSTFSGGGHHGGGAMRSPDAAPAAPTPTAGLESLSPEDRGLAEKRRVCPISGNALGSMGEPYKMVVKGETIFLCCPACEKDVLADPEKALKKVAELRAASGGEKERQP